MFEPNRLFTCALALLLASLVIASQVEAGCFGNLFCRDKNYKSYVKLADQLYEATPSSELTDNVAAAIKLYRIDLEKESPGRDDLLRRFSLLENQWIEDKEEQLCNEFSMRTLNLLAEGMAAAQVKSWKISAPVSRLSLIVVKQIMRATDVCFEYLAGKWPNPWKVSSALLNLRQLDSISRSALLDSQRTLKAKEIEKFGDLSECSIIQEDEQANRILRPYLDLLMAAHIVNPESNKLAKFYKAPGEQIVFKPIHHPLQEVLDNAYRLRACDLLSAKMEKS